MIFTFPLKKNNDFKIVYDNGKSKANNYLVVYILENSKDYNRLGVSVSKKVGNSVVRHRLKRLVKESYRVNEKMFNSGLDIVVIVRNSAADLFFHDVESALLHLFKLHKVVK